VVALLDFNEVMVLIHGMINGVNEEIVGMY
jgi:hypothetical protein